MESDIEGDGFRLTRNNNVGHMRVTRRVRISLVSNISIFA